MTGPMDQAPPASVPMFNRDPVSSLALWTLDFRLGGEDFTVPAHPASMWMSMLMAPVSPLKFMTEMLDPADVARFGEVYVNNDVDLDELIGDLLEAASGRHWWIALRLVSTAQHCWSTVGAALIMAGIHADEIPFAAWLDVFTLKFMGMIKPEQATLWAMQIEMPPEGEEVAEEELEISRDQFLSLD